MLQQASRITRYNYVTTINSVVYRLCSLKKSELPKFHPGWESNPGALTFLKVECTTSCLSDFSKLQLKKFVHKSQKVFFTLTVGKYRGWGNRCFSLRILDRGSMILWKISQGFFLYIFNHKCFSYVNGTFPLKVFERILYVFTSRKNVPQKVVHVVRVWDSTNLKWFEFESCQCRDDKSELFTTIQLTKTLVKFASTMIFY